MVVIPLHKGSNAERSRMRNRLAVLGQVRTAGSIGRAEIARALSLTTQTVSNIIAELLDDGMLQELGRLSSGRGLPAIQYGLHPEGGFALGVEVRPDAILAVLLNMQGETVASQRETLHQTTPDVVLEKVAAVYARLRDQVTAAKDRMLGAGIVMPGPFGVTGIAGMGSDLVGWQEVDAEDLFHKAIGIPVVLSNDANAAAMAERINGVAQEIPTFAYLYFGAGLGLGLIHDGQLLRGAFGNAGEIGHVPVLGGKLEDALSRLSVQQHMAAVGKPADTVEALAALLAERDPDLMAWLERATAALGQAMTIVENIFDPQTVVLGGAMPEGILAHLVNHTDLPDLSVSNRPQAPHPRLLQGRAGRMTATQGAAALILNRALSAPIANLH